MRGPDDQTSDMFSYLSPEHRLGPRTTVRMRYWAPRQSSAQMRRRRIPSGRFDTPSQGQTVLHGLWQLRAAHALALRRDRAGPITVADSCASRRDFGSGVFDEREEVSATFKSDN